MTPTTPASIGPTVGLADRAQRRFRLRRWRTFARAGFLVTLLTFVPSVAWSFSAWTAWLVARHDVKATVATAELPIAASSAFAFLGWLLVGLAAVHAWAEHELSQTTARSIHS